MNETIHVITYLASEKNHTADAVVQRAFDGEGEHNEIDTPQDGKEGVDADVE